MHWAAPACPYEDSSVSCTVWRELAASQFPTDCSKRRLLVHDLEEVTDVGRVVYKVATALAEAFHSRRVLVLSPMRQRAMHAICQHSSGWECIFEPISSCTFEDISVAARQALLMRSSDSADPNTPWEGDTVNFNVPARADIAQFFLPSHLRHLKGKSPLIMQALVTAFTVRLRPDILDLTREVQDLQGFSDLRKPLIGVSLPSVNPCGDFESYWNGCSTKVDATLEAVRAIQSAGGDSGDVVVAIETKEASQEPAELLSAREQDKVKATLLRQGKKAMFLRPSVQYAAALQDDDIALSRAADDFLHSVKHLEILSACDRIAAFRTSALSRAAMLLSVARQLGNASSSAEALPAITTATYLDIKSQEMAWFDTAPTQVARSQGHLPEQLSQKLRARGPLAPDPAPSTKLLNSLHFRPDTESIALSDGVFDVFSAGWHSPTPIVEVVACDPLSESLRQELSASLGTDAGRLFEEAEFHDDGTEEGWWRALAILTEAAWLPGSRRQMQNLRVQIFALSHAHRRSWENLCPRESSEGRHDEAYEAQRRSIAVHLGALNPVERRANAYYMLGKLAVDYDRNDAVAAPLRRALELQPGHALANLALGKHPLVWQGRYSEAVKACKSSAAMTKEAGIKAKALECIGEAVLRSFAADAAPDRAQAIAGLHAYLEVTHIEPGTKLSNHCCTAFGRLASHLFNDEDALVEAVKLPQARGGVSCIGLALLAMYDVQEAERKTGVLPVLKQNLMSDSAAHILLQEEETQKWLDVSADRIQQGKSNGSSCTALLSPTEVLELSGSCSEMDNDSGETGGCTVGVAHAPSGLHVSLVSECSGTFDSDLTALMKYYYGTKRFVATVQAKSRLRCWRMLSLPAVLEFWQVWPSTGVRWTEATTKSLANMFSTSGYAIERGVLPPPVVDALRRYHRAVIDERCAEFQDLQARRFTNHNDRLDAELLLSLLPLAEKVFGRALQPTYSYTATYVRGSPLKAHHDRAHTRFSLNICLGETSSEEGVDEKPWTLYFDKKLQWKRTEREAQILRVKAHSEDPKALQDIQDWETDILGFDMNPGDIFFYRGTHHYHFRKPLPHHRSTHIFLMYAEKDIFPMSAASSTEG